MFPSMASNSSTCLRNCFN